MTVELNLLFLQVYEDSIKMTQDMTKLLEAMKDEILYMKIDEVSKASGMDKRSIRYYAQTGAIRTKDVNPTVKLYHVEDVMKLNQTRRAVT